MMTPPLRRFARAVLALALCAAAEAGFPDLDPPPRKTPYDGLVIEWVGQEPKVAAADVGARSEPPEGTSIRYTAHLRNLAEVVSGAVELRWSVDGGEPTSQAVEAIDAGKTATAEFPWTASKGRHWIRCELAGRAEWLTFATDALTVKVAIEARTLATYEAEHGSFARRMQDSLSGLHSSWATARDPRFAPEGVEERLRIDDVETYERTPGADVPAEFWDHPRFHLYVACDQGGPIGGFYIPGYSIGHNYGGHPGHESLFSDWGENCLWHEIAHFRGVQDFYNFTTENGAVGKTDAAGKPLEDLRLAKAHDEDTMNNPYKETRWSDYSAAVLQAKRGVTRVGRCEDPSQPYGHMWRDVPAAIGIEVVGPDGKPLESVHVELYRPARATPEDRPTVAADAKPIAEGSTDAKGRFDPGGDPFACASEESARAGWLLLVLRREGTVRARYLTLLDANLAYWRGERDRAAFRLEFPAR
mgnify:CR=1 FL=1